MTPGTSTRCATTSCAVRPGRPTPDGRPLQPLPYLLIIVDEFGELLSGRPDFVDLFVQIGRVGRSLGMHLLLATQRLEEGRLRGLESHLSYRICLRTFTAAETRTVIGTTDAYQLPPIPGSAYLKVDATPSPSGSGSRTSPDRTCPPAQRRAQDRRAARGDRPRSGCGRPPTRRRAPRPHPKSGRGRC